MSKTVFDPANPTLMVNSFVYLKVFEKKDTRNSNLTILVLKEFWEVEELRDELFDVIGVVHEGLPCRRDGVELTVGTVKPEPRQDGTDEDRQKTQETAAACWQTINAEDKCRTDRKSG